jgi:choline kinase
MKAIILAAGRGTRISRVVEEIPKCTLPIDNEPLIRRTVEMLVKEGIEPILCIGYHYGNIQKALDGLDVKYYFNPFFDVTNSIASLWFARKELTEDVLLLNADVYFEKKILDTVLADKNDVVLAIDKTRVATGDYFFSTINGCIKKYGKDLPLTERSCEYVGMAKVKNSFQPHFCKRLEELISSQKHDLWWENVLYSFSPQREIRTVDVDGVFWAEIDYFDDYERILNYVSKKNIGAVKEC